MSLFQRFNPSILQKSFLRGLSREILQGVQQNVLSRVNNAPTKMFADEFYPGQVNIEYITLHDGDGKKIDIDFHLAVKNIELYESIARPVMFGEMILSESEGMYERFSLNGDQFVLLGIKTPSRDKVSEYKFHVLGPFDQIMNEGTRRSTYRLELITTDFYNALKRKTLTRTHKGSTSDLIESILKEDLGTERPVTIEPTTGIIEKTIETRSPFSTIHEHYIDAENSTNDHKVYTFFENKDGYHLVSFEKLIKDGRKKLTKGRSDKVFQFVADRNSDAGAIKFRNILAYNQSSFGDAVQAIMGGGLHNIAQDWNPARGIINEAQYIETEDGQAIPLSDDNGKPMMSPSAYSRKEQVPTKFSLHAINSETRPNANLAQVQTRRTAMIQRLLQVQAQIMVYGDTDLAVGDVIRCSFPEATEFTDGDGETKYTSGNYLITHLRHMIINSDQPQHVITCNLMKSGVKGD